MKINLLIKNDITDVLKETTFGGCPVKAKNSDFEWPVCQGCGEKLQYQGKIKTDLGFELIFMCNNGEEACSIWDPDDGANNVVIVVADDVEPVDTPEDRTRLRETEYGCKIIEVDDENYDEAWDHWEGRPRDVLGQLGGTPMWIQGDSTPRCDCCHKEMRFVAQLEEGPDYDTAMNFGGGTAFLFDCPEKKTAKFLWQCY